MKMLKKLTSMILIVAFALTMFPSAILAEDAETLETAQTEATQTTAQTSEACRGVREARVTD